jgi:flagellar biosynthesis/type III secretory pathway M-ring protein FliF/YscJ
MKMNKKNENKFDEMQMQKRGRIGRKLFNILRWVLLLLGFFAISPFSQRFAPARWLAEPMNLARSIVVLFLVFWIIDEILLVRAGASEPLRKRKGALAVAAIFGILFSQFFPLRTIFPWSHAYVVVILAAIVIFTIYFAVRDVRKRKAKSETDCETDDESQ